MVGTDGDAVGVIAPGSCVQDPVHVRDAPACIGSTVTVCVITTRDVCAPSVSVADPPPEAIAASNAAVERMLTGGAPLLEVAVSV